MRRLRGVSGRPPFSAALTSFLDTESGSIAALDLYLAVRVEVATAPAGGAGK